MPRALELAWRGWGRVQPNPLVGAVVLRRRRDRRRGLARRVRRAARRGDRAGRGGRRGPAGRRWSCTLEPCAHQGKQPPCTDAILARRHRGGSWRRSPIRIRWRPAARRGCAPPASTVELGLLRRRGRGAERRLPPPTARHAPALRRAQARHHARRPHRRRQRPLALDLRRSRRATSCSGSGPGSTRSPSAA